ncbi:MAG TPA: FHA domain-containing protein, partial [Polyangiaceae bacterium]|nr:FHA domain-containing protein [Polyangiaceae bacterium]
SVIKCAKCSKENQDHYKFCLGCGSELPKDAPKQFQAESLPPKMAAHVAAADKTVLASDPPPAPVKPVVVNTPPPNPVPNIAADPGCPQCGHPNGPGNRFCAACGYKLGGAAPAVVAAASAAAPVEAAGPHVSLTALRADGSEAGAYRFPTSPTVTVGRDTGTIFAGDSYLSPRHATFTFRGNEILVRDEGSLNGVYVKLTPRVPYLLEPGSVFRIGQEIVRFEALVSDPKVAGVEKFGSPAKGIVGRLALVIGRDTTGNAFPIPTRGLHLGRERGDILFSEDGYVSGLHCRVGPGDDGRVYLTDVGSSNGTFVRVRENHRIAPSDILLMGQQVFRLDVA